MILSALVQYYDRLEAQDGSDIAPIGFSRQKISFIILLNPDGSLSAFQDARVEDGGRMVSRQIVAPGQAKSPGAGLNPGFLWDSGQYMLGFKAEDPKPERTRQAFEAFRDRHLEQEKEIDDKAFSAVCAFLRSWSPKDAASHDKLAEIATAFGVFRLVGAREFVHERSKIKEYWLGQSDADDDVPRAPSLISGEMQQIARLHEPKIKGVRGAQTSGAALVSFNEDAYESYGKSQSFNAPVGVEDAFKYCTALNRLTTSRDRPVHLGDTTVVFWTEKPTDFETVFPGVFENDYVEDEGSVIRLKNFFDSLRRAVGGGTFDNGDVLFYVLGLSPNAARVSVRFWHVGTVQQFAERLGQHLTDIKLAGGPPDMPLITIQRIIDQTARERDDIQPQLAGAMQQAVLSGGPSPASVAAAVLRRIRADGQTDGVNGHIRAAILKAYLIRKARLSKEKEIVFMSLDKTNTNVAYRLGRLFAALEKTQEDAMGGDLNVTIKDRYFSSASANPVTAFPRLLRLHAHHLDKLGADKRGFKIAREKIIQEICEGIDPQKGFPARLPLDEQGLFFIGYYHQRQDFFTSKKTEIETIGSASSAQ